MPSSSAIYSVSEINTYIKSVLTSNDALKFVRVKGEVSNLKKASNGHIYFSLKDKTSLIAVCFFATYANKLIDEFKNGDEITVFGSLDVYVSKGNYQLIAYEVEFKGRGDILLELEKLKKKLFLEGLFDPSRKREINRYPNNIGVITAPNSAAIKDIVFNINRRYPFATIYFFKSQVQGENASKDLLNAFYRSQEYNLDTLIIGRGGGSNEDLNAFNDETLVRAVATSKMPVISAVGHEIDSSLLDLVADKKASTPSAASELATIDIKEVIQYIDHLSISLKQSIYKKLDYIKKEIAEEKEYLDSLLTNKLNNLKKDIKYYKDQLAALNPNNILARGYSLSLDKNGNVIKDISQVNLGENIETVLKNGKIKSTIIGKEN